MLTITRAASELEHKGIRHDLDPVFIYSTYTCGWCGADDVVILTVTAYSEDQRTCHQEYRCTECWRPFTQGTESDEILWVEQVEAAL